MLKRSAFEAFTGSTKLIFLKHWFCWRKIFKILLYLTSTQLVLLKKIFKILLYLTSTQSYYQISNGGIFCFSTTVTNHHTPAIALRQFTSDNTNKQTLTAEKIQGCFGERCFFFSSLTQVSRFAREEISYLTTFVYNTDRISIRGRSIL